MELSYSLDPVEVKKVIDAVLKDKPYNKDQFLYYHLYRNYFNVKDEVNTLKRTGDKRYIDNKGNTWEEQSILKNFFHMPIGNFIGSNLGLTKPSSRKFLRDDKDSAIGGEFEMIIRADGKRIDALTNAEYQETYNFGKTRNMGDHKTLDVDTHRKNGDYSFKKDMGKVIITE